MFRIRLTKEFDEHVTEERRQAAAIRNMAGSHSGTKDRALTCINTEIVQNSIQGFKPFELKNNWY